MGESRAVFRDLAERYAAAIDAADPDALAALFAPGGGLVIRADSFARVDGEWRFAVREVTALWVKVEPLPRVGLTLDRALAAVRW